MEEIIVRQHDAAKPMEGRRFVLGVAGVLLCMALAQAAVNLLITITGIGLLNVAFYVLCVWLIISFMRRTVASCVYTLRPDMLVLEKRLGDSPISVVQIPLKSVISMRPVYMGERLKTSYRQVTVIDPAAAPCLRMRLAFVLSLFSASLARRCAGGMEETVIGSVLVFGEDGQQRACVFRPNEKLRAAMAERIADAAGFDERMTRAKVRTLYARALQRAFPALYGYVDPLMKPEDYEAARAELEQQKEKKRAAREKTKPDAKKKTEKAETKKEKPGGKSEEPSRRRRKQE